MTTEVMWTAFAYGFVPAFGFVLAGAVTVYVVSRFIAQLSAEGQFAWIWVFALLGGILGFSTGNSREPTVAILLNTLLAMITLALGYVFGKDRVGPDWRALLPYCMLALLVTATYGLFVGAVARGEYERYEASVEQQRLHEQRVLWELEKAEGLKDLDIPAR